MGGSKGREDGEQNPLSFGKDCCGTARFNNFDVEIVTCSRTLGYVLEYFQPNLSKTPRRGGAHGSMRRQS